MQGNGLGLTRSICHEINLLYLLARCLDTMLADIEMRLAPYNDSFSAEPKRRLKEFTHKVEQAGAQFRNFVEPVIMKSVNGDWKQYEMNRQYANELIRLIMFYYEVCTKDSDSHSKVFDTLSECSEKHRMGVFSEEDINRFNLGCKKNGEN